MSGSAIQDLVAEKIKMLYSISQELEDLFPGRHYTPDGHMIGSIGEALAACCYEIKLFEASEKTHDGQAPMGIWFKSRQHKLSVLLFPVSRNGCSY